MSVQTLKEIEAQVHPSTTQDYWLHISNQFGISKTLACAIAQPPGGKSILRLSPRKKDNLIMEIHNLQGTVKDIERIVPGCNKYYIQKVIEKNAPTEEKNSSSVQDELVEYKKITDEAVMGMKKDKKGMWIPREVIDEAKKSDMPIYDFVSFLYENYKEDGKVEAPVQVKEVEKVVEKEVIKEVPVEEKQVLLRSITESIQNQDSYPDMRKLRAAFEIISGIINRTLSLEKVKELVGGCSK